MAGRCEWCKREAEDVTLVDSEAYCPGCRKKVAALDALMYLAMMTDPKQVGIEKAREVKEAARKRGLL